MELLDSILAFALIMAALASVVTLIMELFHRVLRLRAKGMKHLFEQFYQDVLSKELATAKGKEQTIINAVLYSPVRDKLIAESRFLPKPIVEFLTSHTEVNTDELLTRLDQAGALDDVRKKTRSEFRKALEIIEAKYDDYNAAATDYFKRRAQFFSLLVGIVLAFAVNIDGMRILDSLMTNSQMRASIISQQPGLEKSFQETQKTLARLRDSDGTVAQPDKQKLADLDANMSAISQKLDQFGSLGVPIGWRYPAGPFMAHNSGGFLKTIGNLLNSIGQDPAGFLIWMFKVFITGLLIGLGAPFWFDVARKLSQIKQAFKGKGASSPPANSPAAIGQTQAAKTTIDKIVDG